MAGDTPGLRGVCHRRPGLILRTLLPDNSCRDPARGQLPRSSREIMPHYSQPGIGGQGTSSLYLLLGSIPLPVFPEESDAPSRVPRHRSRSMLRPSAMNLSCDTRHRLAGLLSILR